MTTTQCPDCKRYFIDQELLERHACTARAAQDDGLVQLAQKVGRSNRSPLGELNNLQELLERAEVMKAQLVARARQDGHSWQMIANNIGGTKQAAQQRYGTKPAQTPDTAQLTLEDAADAQPTPEPTTTKLDRQATPTRVAVVACSAAKLDHAAPAGELYVGSFHKAARATADAMVSAGHVDRVLILSAKHGLLELDEVVEPYERKMTDRTAVTEYELEQDLLRKNVGYVDALTPSAYSKVLSRAVTLLERNDSHTGCTLDLELADCPGIGMMRHELRVLRLGWAHS